MHADIERVIKVAFAQVKAVTPVNKRNTKSRGNLKEHGVKVNFGLEEAHLHIDETEAPYMKYTNEPWSTFKPPLFGKQNPNEEWFDKAVEKAVRYIHKTLGGTLK